MKRDVIQVPASSSDKRERGLEPFYREVDNAIARLTRFFVVAGSAGFLLAVLVSRLIGCDLAAGGWLDRVSIFGELALLGLMIFGCAIWAALQFRGAMNSLVLASFEKSPGKENSWLSHLLTPIGAERPKVGLGIFALALAGALMTTLVLVVDANLSLLDRLFSRAC